MSVDTMCATCVRRVLHVFRIQVFVRGGLLLFAADGPGRAKAMGCKHPNAFSRFPCAYCMCEQKDDETGGELGNAKFDIGVHRRTYGATRAGFDDLESHAGQPDEQTKLSMELGLVVPDPNEGELPLWTTQRINPLQHCPVERLHFDALVSVEKIQVVFQSMPTPAGINTT